MPDQPPSPSPLGLGTVQFGLDYGLAPRVEPDEAIRVVHAAIELGINYIDTARAYGASEEVLGEALADLPRDHFIIATKIEPGFELSGEEELTDWITRSLERSLTALALDRVDVLQVHNLDRATYDHPPFWEALHRVREQGGFDRFGASLYEIEVARAMLDSPQPEIRQVQIPYSVLDRRFEPFLEGFGQADITTVARSAFLKGVLATNPGELPAELSPLREPIDRLTAHATSLGLEPSELALLYARSHPDIASTIIGVLDEQMLRANHACLARATTELRSLLEDLALDDPLLVDPRNWPLS